MTEHGHGDWGQPSEGGPEDEQTQSGNEPQGGVDEQQVAVYRARVLRRDRRWLVDVPDVGVTQAGRLGDVEERARELISLRRDDDVPVKVEVDVQLDEAVRVNLDTAVRARAKAAELEQQAGTALADAARQLVAADISLRDAAQILGLSHQRVSDLAQVGRHTA